MLQLVQFPTFYKITQSFANSGVDDLSGATRQALAEESILSSVNPGDRIAITAGSRGITGIGSVLRTVGEEVKKKGGIPFLVAAMGSHGGGTAAGMLAVLSSLEISAETVGMPIEASDRVQTLGKTKNGLMVYCAQEACQADGIIVVNRIKPHTSFRGDHESGLVKMLAVGLGRPVGAAEVHRLPAANMAEAVREIGLAVLEQVPVIGGIGIVENANERPAIVRGTTPRHLPRVDKELLIEARKLMPLLPVGNLDLLVVKEMGKNYSGTGMDTNVIGRFYLEGVAEPTFPGIRRIVVLALSEQSHGNANGVGLADFITRRFFDTIDFETTYLNGLTTNYLQRIKLPVIMPNDEQAVLKAWQSLRCADPRRVRAAVIDNTLHLEQMYLSAAVAEEVKDKPSISVEGKAKLMFNEGKLHFQ